jgi:hypothetical protein
MVRALDLPGQEQPFVLQVSPRGTGHERLHFPKDGVTFFPIGYHVWEFELK